MATRTARTEKLDLRLTQDAKRRISAAATAANRSMSDFVLQSALDRADETLADRRIFSLNAEQWAALHAALDAPPRTLPRLADLLRSRTVFDRDNNR